MTVQVDELDEKFYVTTFLKGLRIGTFSGALFIQKLGTMDEILTRTPKTTATIGKKGDERLVEEGRRGDTRHNASSIEHPTMPYL